MARVIVLDPLAQEGLDLLEAAPDVEFEVLTGLSGDALRKALAQFDAAICRSGVQITAESLKDNRRLRAIVRAGVGTDNIEKVAATRSGIVVMNTPTGNTLSTAEHTIALMLALSRNIPPANQGLVEGRWDRKKFMGTQLAGKTLGIVGLGRVGQAVARRAQALEMRVLGYDPFLTAERAEKAGIESVPEVEAMLPRIDFLTVHTPLTAETRDLIGMAQLEVLKPGVRLINCARGGIYNEAAMVAGLKSGKLAGVALDVFENEPCTDSPLFGMPGVVATPHLGASTEEAQTQVAVEAVQLVLDFLSTGAIRHAVNVSPLDPKTLASMRGYLDVAYRLGLLHAQMDNGAVLRCRLVYRGEVTQKDTKLLTASFAAGLLENALSDSINIVNAEMLLAERGIEIIEQCDSAPGDFASLILAEMTTEKKSYMASGTLFGKKAVRLVRLGDFRLEAYLDGILLIFTHHDVPGIIGRVGTIFGRHDVNIAQMSVGRAGETPGGEAIGVLNLDSPPPEAALSEVLDQPGITSATVIQLPPAGEGPAWMIG
jgi:D-3-phosphoglycerate dehydrogenase